MAANLMASTCLSRASMAVETITDSLLSNSLTDPWRFLRRSHSLVPTPMATLVSFTIAAQLQRTQVSPTEVSMCPSQATCKTLVVQYPNPRLPRTSGRSRSLMPSKPTAMAPFHSLSATTSSDKAMVSKPNLSSMADIRNNQ